MIKFRCVCHLQDKIPEKAQKRREKIKRAGGEKIFFLLLFIHLFYPVCLFGKTC